MRDCFKSYSVALMLRLPCLPALLCALIATPASAVVRGEVARDPNGVRNSVVRVESSRGELCSGAIIGPDLVLTAAHCLTRRAEYWVVGVDRNFRERRFKAIAAALHPAFVAGTTPETQPGIDLALLKVAQPFGADFAPLDTRDASRLGSGEAVGMAGFGVTAEGRRASAKTLRQARLVTVGPMQVANGVVMVVDEQRLAASAGAGACLGDFGGPILSLDGARLLAVVSWASGAMAPRTRTACGGFTAVTPIAEHAAWIAARSDDLDRLPPLPAARAGAWTRGELGALQPRQR